MITRYFKVIRRLILTYTLEPAGSHGVWGLDDHFFMPYIFGSAQLTRPINENEPMPLEGSVPGAPRPADVTKAATVDMHREDNMYFAAIGFINDVKKGPFWEHSPILFDISGIRDGWGKINKGMLKMLDAEVLGKFPVVQHFPFGSLFSWDVDADAAAAAQTVHTAHQPTSAVPSNPAAPSIGTAAPWAQKQTVTPMTGTAAPWAQPPPANPIRPVGPASNTTPAGVAFDQDLSAVPSGPLPRGQPGTASAQHTITKAPWA
jgi:serine/threonine-protein phosphatase 2A activator